MEKSGVGFWEGYGAHLAGANRALAGGPLSAQKECRMPLNQITEKKLYSI